MASLLHSLSTRKGKKKASESTSASPEASTSQLPKLREDPHSIVVTFPAEDPRGQGIYLNNRTKDNLPTEIKGKVTWLVWEETLENPQNSYTFWDQEEGAWKSIEYINRSWYRTYWNTFQGKYNATSEDRIDQLHLLGLGTAILPYETREEKPKESPEEESPQEPKTVSNPDKPTATLEATLEVEHLAGQFHTASLEPSPHDEFAHVWGYKIARQVYQEMATAATTITAPQQITAQAAPPLLPAPPPQQPQQPPLVQQPPQQPAPGGGGGAPPSGGGGGGE
jgi:hypothetical protein